MKFKLIPTERRIARQFKVQKVEVAQAENEMRRLVTLSQEKFKGRGVPATLNFDDETGNGWLTSLPVEFNTGTSLNVTYYAVQMLDECYAKASQALKDDFLNQLYVALARKDKRQERDEEEQLATKEADSTPLFHQKECVSCGEMISEKMAYCPYCGESQTIVSSPQVRQEKHDISEMKQNDTITQKMPTKQETITTSHFQIQLEALISQRLEENRLHLEQQLAERVRSKQAAARQERTQALDQEKATALHEAAQRYEQEKEEIQAHDEKKRRHEFEVLEMALSEQATTEREEALQKQEESAQALMTQLKAFLSPTRGD